MGWVTIKTLGDDQIEAFMRCPYRFYHGWIKGKSSQPEWRMRVQYVVNRIVKDFYTLPQNKRSSLQVLELIEKYWKSFIRSDIFPTRSQGYITLVKLTDHLLQSLQALDPDPPLFLYEKWSTYLDEPGIKLFLTIQVGQWGSRSYRLKKFIVDDQQEAVFAYYHLVTVFCDHAFGALPEHIEVVSLLSGKIYQFYPEEGDVSRSLKYIHHLKKVMEQKKSYRKGKRGLTCIDCPFHIHCSQTGDNLNGAEENDLPNSDGVHLVH